MEGERKLRVGWKLHKNAAIACWNDNTFRLAAVFAFYLSVVLRAEVALLNMDEQK
jgi:hypothetical protein